MNHILDDSPLFRGLSKEHLVLLEDLSTRERLPAGTILLKEGDTSSQFYLILEGDVDILKCSEDGIEHRIRILTPGDLIGELAFLDKTPRSATAKTATATEVLRIDGSTLARDPSYSELHAMLVIRIAELLSERLRHATTVTARSMQAELTAAQTQIAMGYLMVSIMSVSAVYVFALGLITALKEHVPSTTPITIVFLLFFALVYFLALHRGGYPLASYGLSLQNWPQVALQGVLYSFPVLAGITALKWAFIHLLPSYQDASLFQPLLPLSGQSHPAWILVATPVVYQPVAEVQISRDDR